MLRLTAIVPATNEPATLTQCLEALRAAADPPEEVIVVTEPPNSSPAAARNAGARDAAGEVLLFVDADVVVHPDALTKIREAFAADPQLAALFGSYDDAPAAGGLVSVFRNLLHHHVHQSSPGPASTFWAGLGAVRRDVFLEVDGFDAERFRRASIEDVELGTRLAARGERIELRPDVQGMHLKSWSLRDMVATDFRRRGIPWVGLLLRTRASSRALNLGWAHRLGTVAALAGLGALATRRLGAVAAAAVGIVVLNRRFYALLLRRYGPVATLAGVLLHALHYLSAAAAIPAGLVAHLRDRVR